MSNICDISKGDLVTLKSDPFKVEKPKAIRTMADAEREIRMVTPEYWECLNLTSKGYEVKDIYEKFHGRYTMQEITYMIDRVMRINIILHGKDRTILREKMVSKLHSLERQVWTNAGVADDNQVLLDDKSIKLLLQINDRITNLQGLNAPELIEVNVTQKIIDDRNSLAENYNSFMQDAGEIIDMVPIDESSKDND